MSSSFMLFTIIIFTFNQICICKSADVSDIRRLRIRAAMSDPIEESCKGSLDFNGFSKLDKICKDCFNLIREPEIYQLCRSDCFCNGIFSDLCAREVLLLNDDDISQLPYECPDFDYEREINDPPEALSTVFIQNVVPSSKSRAGENP